MELKPIHDETSYQAALAEVELLLSAREGSSEADRLEVLSLLIENYEQAHYPIEAPDPIAFIEYIMESRELTRKDLEAISGQERVFPIF